MKERYLSVLADLSFVGLLFAFGSYSVVFFIFRDSELLQGVFDKNQFGASAYGFVHLCYELLGPGAAGILLSIFARTFTAFLQMRGFSCCTGDFLMTPEGETRYARQIVIMLLDRIVKRRRVIHGSNERFMCV